MKKILIIFEVVAVICSIYSCKKEVLSANEKNDFLNDAKDYFNSYVINNDAYLNTALANLNQLTHSKVPIWENAFLKKGLQNTLLFIPLKFDSLYYVSSSVSGKNIYLINEASQLCIYKDSFNLFHAVVVTFIPDSNSILNRKSSFTGIINIDTWEGIPLEGFRITNNSILTMDRENSIKYSNSFANALSIGKDVESMMVIETCYYVEGYNYVPGSNESYYYTIETNCSYDIVDDIGGSSIMASDLSLGTNIGGGSGGLINPLVSMPLLSGKNIISNIKDYNKCFTNMAGNNNNYTVSVCVDQPIPGTRAPWGFATSGSSASNNLINVGHVFLIFTENTANGTIRRNLGFYPANYVTPANPSDNGQLNNDEQHNYNISLTINVTGSSFFNMLNYINNNGTSYYNLNSNNCTSFVLHTLEAGFVDIPSRFGSWAGGSGYDPGDLGEDIRSMALQPGMSKYLNEVSHLNSGTCN